MTKESKFVTQQEAVDNLGDVNKRYNDVDELLCRLVDYYNTHDNLSKYESLVLEYGLTNAYQACEEALNLLKGKE